MKGLDQRHLDIRDHLLSLGKEVYFRTPSSLRFIFKRADLLYHYAQALALDSWKISGIEPSSQQYLNFLYCGLEKNKNYMADMLLGDSRVEVYQGKRWLWQLSPSSSDRVEYSLMITEIPLALHKYFKRQDAFYLPYWAYWEVDIPDNIDQFMAKSSSLSSNLRKIRKNDLRIELSREPAALRTFFDEMYLPYISKRHGDAGFIEDFDFLRILFPKCDLLFLKKGEEAWGGILILYEQGEARLWLLGIREGNFDFVRDGAISALYYYSYRHLKEKGYNKVSLGGTRPFLRDGLVNYKLRWQPRLRNQIDTGFLFMPLTKAPAVQHFLRRNPLIYFKEGGFHIAVFMDSTLALSGGTLERILAEYYVEGLSKPFLSLFVPAESGALQSFSDQITLTRLKYL